VGKEQLLFSVGRRGNERSVAGLVDHRASVYLHLIPLSFLFSFVHL
jgi:hypothetical protein